MKTMSEELYQEEIIFCGRKIRLVLVEYDYPKSHKKVHRVHVKNIQDKSNFVIPTGDKLLK